MRVTLLAEPFYRSHPVFANKSTRHFAAKSARNSPLRIRHRTSDSNMRRTPTPQFTSYARRSPGGRGEFSSSSEREPDNGPDTSRTEATGQQRVSTRSLTKCAPVSFYRGPKARRIAKKSLTEGTGLSNGQIASLVSIGGAIGLVATSPRAFAAVRLLSNRLPSYEKFRSLQ